MVYRARERVTPGDTWDTLRMMLRAASTALAFFALATPAQAARPWLSQLSAERATIAYAIVGEGGYSKIRACERHSPTVVVCRYSVFESTGDVATAYHGQSYVRIRDGQVVIRDPELGYTEKMGPWSN